MKLNQITTRYYTIALLIVLFVWSVVFFFILKNQVVSSTDHALKQREIMFLNQPTLPAPGDTSKLILRNEYVISAIDSKAYHQTDERYADTLLSSINGEVIPFRFLQTGMQYDNRFFKVTILKARLEGSEILSSILIDQASMFVILMAVLLIINRVVVRKVWQPFYRIIDKMRRFDLQQQEVILKEQSGIEEFDNLSESIELLTKKSYQTYVDQREFIENMTHEMQTPLAVMQSKIELMLQRPDLDAAQAQFYDEMGTEIRRLNKFNRSLLLLSKIENNFYVEKKQLDLAAVFEDTIQAFEPKIEYKNLSVTKAFKGFNIMSANQLMIEIIYTNLIKNALVHNVTNGFLEVQIENRRLIMANSGDAPKTDPQKLIKRYWSSKKTDSSGLGLSIVSRICEVNNYDLNYVYEDEKHILTVNFDKN